MKKLLAICCLVTLAAGVDLAKADTIATTPVYWADWTAMTVGTNGSVSGTLMTPGGSVGVTYTGDVLSYTQLNNSPGPYIWDEPYAAGEVGSPHSHPYTGSGYSAPSENDVIALQKDPSLGYNTITFSKAVLNPIMAIVSMGAPGSELTWTFGAESFTVLSEGIGHWKVLDSDLWKDPVATNVLKGREGNGVIQFWGEFTSIDWTVLPSGGEIYSGFTLGAVVPTPSSFAALIGMGLVGLVGVARRRWKK
jgi:hypothetical protein